ncbi:MAG: alpha/beta hydrolase [Actinomycetota bacterium]
MDVQILEGCEGFALGDGPVGALLVHGYTGSPQGLRDLGEELARAGIAVQAPLLPGHGTTWQDLSTRTADEWTSTVENAYEELAGRTEEVFLVSLSFGSALALDFTARHPRKIAGLVSLAGMVFNKDPLRHLAPLAAKVVKSIPGVGNDIADPDNRIEIAYNRVPTRSTVQMLRMCARAKRALPQVTVPILIMHGREDHTVHPSNATYIYDNVGSADKELLWLERSYHVITLDYDRDVLTERTLRFIKERASHAI